MSLSTSIMKGSGAIILGSIAIVVLLGMFLGGSMCASLYESQMERLEEKADAAEEKTDD